jgi:anthranilate phosphoribosyltransferase
MMSKIDMKQALGKLIEGESLTREEARSVMTTIMEGEATTSQIGALLTALRIKGETVQEIAGFAEVMREKSIRLNHRLSGVLDTCGTGGSGIHKFNVSTTSAIICASLGVPVAKHGNRAMSGKSGSADVLEALGVNIMLTHEQAAACLENIGICFMFAQNYHPSMKHAAGPRRELGIRTVFNVLGPLTNPANAEHQLMGIYDRSKTELIACVLRELGSRHALVVGSLDGLDEISICAPTKVSELRNGEIRTYEIAPEELGLSRHSLEQVMGGEPAHNAKIVREVLGGAQGAYRDIVLINAAASLYAADRCEDLREGVQLAAQAIDSGAALRKLQELIDYTGVVSHVS